MTTNPEKKKKYLQACSDQRRHFTPFVSSVDAGLLGKEATELIKRLASLTASHWGTTYSKVCGYFKARMSISILRATHYCLRGSRVSASKEHQLKTFSAFRRWCRIGSNAL
eukprot:scaffold14401_cov59-Attheya_sp.AAC.1